MLFGIIGWIVLGMLAGHIASRYVDLRGDDPRLGVGVGGGAALIGGWLYSVISGDAVTAWNFLSLLTAGVFAIIALLIWHRARRRSNTGSSALRRPW